MTKSKLRKFLIKHLDDAIVDYKLWGDRDTPSAQEKQAIMRMYLRAWCDFKLMSSYEDEVKLKDVDKYLLEKDTYTMYISIFHYEFEDDWRWHTSYTPHPVTLKYYKDNQRDWY